MMTLTNPSTMKSFNQYTIMSLTPLLIMTLTLLLIYPFINPYTMTSLTMNQDIHTEYAYSCTPNPYYYQSPT